MNGINFPKIRKSHCWAFLSILAYRISLDIIYYHIISKVWGYENLVLNINVTKLIESYFLLFLIFLLMPKDRSKVSNIIIWFLILFSFAPMLTIYSLKNESRTYMYYVTSFWVLVMVLSRLPSVSIPPLKQRYLLLPGAIVSLCVFGILLVIVPGNFSLDSFNLTRVHEIRSEYVQGRMIFFAGYILTWLGYVVNPLLFAWFIDKKRWLTSLIFLVFQMLIFSVTGMKTFLFILLFVLGMMWILKRRNPLLWSALGLTGGVVLGMWSYWLVRDVWIAGLFTERGLLDPAQLSFFYYDFFSKNEYVYLSSHRIFRIFFDYPYHLDPPHLISEIYFNKPQGSANNGIVADGYMNFGILGLIVWAVFLLTILKLIDSLAKGKNTKVSIAPIIGPVIFGLTNSPLFTTLSTHGLLLAMFLLWLLPKDEKSFHFASFCSAIFEVTRAKLCVISKMLRNIKLLPT